MSHSIFYPKLNHTKRDINILLDWGLLININSVDNFFLNII